MNRALTRLAAIAAVVAALAGGVSNGHIWP
jgi:hypothetical protein